MFKNPLAPLRFLFSTRDFRLLFIGQFISLLGDQFYLIALPWLVLRVTGNSLALGGILALQALPRALFMLVGGALTDRFSPRLMMLLSNLARMTLVAALSILVFFNLTSLWILYAIALALGVADAFFYPAQTAIVPRVTPRPQLSTANAVMQGSNQLTLFFGAALAGVVIALFSTPGAELRGISYALLIDAFTFVASALTLRAMSMQASGRDLRRSQSVVRSIREGMSYVRRDATMRVLFLMVVAVNFTVLGPVTVGIPVLVNSRLAEGAVGYGIVMSIFGLGSLTGIAFAGLTRRPSAARAVTALAIACYAFAAGMALLGIAHSLVVIVPLMFILGTGAGYLVVLYVTWLQARTPDHMMGRIMGLFMFATVGLVPISQALTGALARLSLTWVFIASGAIIALVTFFGYNSRALRHIGTDPIHEEPASLSIFDMPPLGPPVHPAGSDIESAEPCMAETRTGTRS